MTELAVRTSKTITTLTVADVAVDAIVDLVDGKAWLRADGYLPGRDDIPLATDQVRRLGLRRGDLITGFARIPATRKPATLRVETVNGRPPGRRPDFYALTPLHPTDRLHLDTTRQPTAPQQPTFRQQAAGPRHPSGPHPDSPLHPDSPRQLTGRVIDLLMPIGKGQRALIVAPPMAGKTTVLEDIADAIATNHPECRIMAVLVDERPEEVTALSRSIRGEVVAATFDRPPQEHTAVAELAIERAKRLVELGEDVVVLLDSITRLGRAYNLLAPGRGRTLSGGLDSSALHPPKQFLGAARNIEGGGSLTIIATALVENGSAMDTLIFEELKSTGNAELKLDRTLAEARIFPAVDIVTTGTRRDEALLTPDERAVITHLRRALSNSDRREAMQQLLARLRQSSSNADFLRQVATGLRA